MRAAIHVIVVAAVAGLAAGDALWPRPKSAAFPGGCVRVTPAGGGGFTVRVVGANSTLLADAVARFLAVSFVPAVPSVAPADCGAGTPPPLPFLDINVTSGDESLGLNTSEAYTLAVPAAGGPAAAATLTADTVFAAMRGLETLSQLLDFVSPGAWNLPAAAIADAPAFPHRGALIDTARHFLPLPSLLAMIDAMAYSKMNVFHWHIVDDQSFPWVSTSFPALSANGAYGAPDPAAVAAHTYAPADVAAVIAYARARGIRTLPEFDTPGHSQSWGAGVPGLLTQCYNTTTGAPIPGSFGPIDPTSNATWQFLPAFFAEVAATFPDAYIHVGGDEVSFTCWASNPQVAAWMAANGLAPGDYAGLESYYVQRVLDLVAATGKSYIGWEEIFDNGLKLAPSTVVNVWKYHNTGQDSAAGPTWQSELFNVTRAGYAAVVSSPWYLNYISYGDDWVADDYLTADILDFGGTPEQQALVLGGELSMWGEFVDATNVVSRTWPRGSAVAEALWSRPGASANITDATARLLAHQCRLLNRGIAAEPSSGPAYCPREWAPPYTPPWAQATAAARGGEL
jgi:hexosaminidase